MIPNSYGRDFKDNANPPAIRFIKRHGRVIPIVNRHKKVSLTPVVEQRLSEMAGEVKHAERGMRGVGHDEQTGIYRNFATKSTFPSWYSQIGFKNKGDFQKVMIKRDSKKFDALAGQAIEDLRDGYDTSFGRVPPDMDFRVKTRQTFDNRGVVFRKLDGIIRPLRFKNKTIKLRDDEVPF